MFQVKKNQAALLILGHYITSKTIFPIVTYFRSRSAILSIVITKIKSKLATFYREKLISKIDTAK